ncbi:hypothetical protein PXI52_006693, partial [Pseudomonas aeruginosa]
KTLIVLKVSAVGVGVSPRKICNSMVVRPCAKETITVAENSTGRCFQGWQGRVTLRRLDAVCKAQHDGGGDCLLADTNVSERSKDG